MKRKALRAAFPHALPIMAGFLFLGAAYDSYFKCKTFVLRNLDAGAVSKYRLEEVLSDLWNV